MQKSTQELQQQTDYVKILLKNILENMSLIDPSGMFWEMRVVVANHVFTIFDQPRFQEKPVDIDTITIELKSILSFVDNFSAETISARQYGGKDPTETLDRTAFLYGVAWDLLGERTYLDAAELFSRRFNANGIDMSMLQGTTALDLGSGIGRNCKAMADLGADRVIGVDLSPVNVSRATERLAQFPIANKIHLNQGNIYDFFDQRDDQFDFICCQGVIHHLEFPEKGIEKIAALLKQGGHAFIYVFGDQGKGCFWDSVDLMRELLIPVPILFTRDFLKIMGISGIKNYYILDNGYVPYQYRFKSADFEAMMERNGLTIKQKMTNGEIYDLNRRQEHYEADKVFYGDCDLRYILER